MKASSTAPPPNTPAVAASRTSPNTREAIVSPATTGTPASVGRSAGVNRPAGSCGGGAVGTPGVVADRPARGKADGDRACPHPRRPRPARTPHQPSVSRFPSPHAAAGTDG